MKALRDIQVTSCFLLLVVLLITYLCAKQIELHVTLG